jgi:Right handed beta helix region
MRRRAMMLAILALLPMPAARAEVTECKVIAALPAVIDSSGVWCLKQDLTWNGINPAIHIQRSFVTLDLNGYSLKRGAGSPQNAAIYGYDLNKITIRNGTIRGFYEGIFLPRDPAGPNARSGRHLIEAMTVEQSEIVGIFVAGDGNIVRDNRVVRTRSSTPGQSAGIQVVYARNTLVAGNVVSGTSGLNGSIGIQVFNSQMIEVRGNSIFDTKRGRQSVVGIYVTGNSNAVTVEGNRITNESAGTDGILANSATMVSCISNVVVGYTAPITGCNFVSGNLTP